MSDELTGDTPFESDSSGGVVANTHVQDARCNSYDVRHNKSGASAKETAQTRGVEREIIDDSSSKAATARYNIAQYGKSAKEAVARIETAAGEGDFMEAVAAGGVLTDAVARLWDLRKHREGEFAEIINLFGIALAKLDFETLTSRQIGLMERFLDECVLAGATDETDVRHARDLLRKAGFDPWRALSIHGDA